MKLEDGDYWVDDCGSWNHVELGQLCPFSHDPVVRDRFGLDFAFRRLGMVRVCKRPRTVTVQWDITEVNDESLSSAASCLWDLQGVERAKLRYYFGGWAYEIFCSVREACLRLEALQSYRKVILFPGIRIRSLGETTETTEATPLIRRARTILAANEARIDAGLWNRFAEEGLSGRVLLFQEEGDGAWLSYRYIGRTSLFAQVFGTSVLGELVGQHCAVDPSHNRVGQDASRDYLDVIANRAERVDQVLMPVQQNDDDGMWVSYQRMLTACRDRSGRNLLLLLTDYTQERLIAA